VALDPAAPDPRLQLAAQQRDHGPLVLGKDHSLWLVGPDGSEPHQLTDSLQAIWPVWSPDREQIAFLAPDPDDPMDTMALYTVAVDGSHPKRLASGVSAHTAPSWSPDGRTIAYTSFAGYDPVTESGSISVRTVDVASGNETDLTGQDYSLAFNPSWSPDGADLAFVAKDLRNNQRPQQATGDVIIVNMETKQFENVTDGAVRDVWSVAWSPRADDLLLFSLYGQTWYEPPETAVRLLHRATGAIAPIAEADEHPTAPVWSPDGSRFVFTIGDRTIVIADVAGQRVTADADKPLSGEITWSPDGGAFLLAPWDADTASTLVDLSGAQPSLSTVRLEFDANPPFVAPPQWAPAVALAPADNPSLPLPGGSGGATAR
jgi:Tol biopolymer transport system component